MMREQAAILSEHALDNALRDSGMLSSEQWHIVRQEQAHTRLPISRLVVELGFVPEASLGQLLANRTVRESLDLAKAVFDPHALQKIPASFARQNHLIPLDYDEETQRLSLAMAKPEDLPTLDRIRQHVGKDIELSPRHADEASIGQAIDRCYGHELSIDGILHELQTGKIAPQEVSTAVAEYRQPIVRLVDAILTDAVKRDASDIHFEPEAAFLRLRYRIDGQLQQIRILRKSYWPAMTVRLKILAGMNIAEMRAPQDGRIALTVSGRNVDLRAATQPTIHGENLVLRILDRDKGIVPLDRLELGAPQLHTLKQMIARPAGIVLVTGPTGSGKTTTLYSVLNHLNRENVHIMTLEDPVEYPMSLIRQTSVAEACKLDFANGIRSIMRQDPDIILIGEIRDQDSAAMAFQAAMTGHQVYSTLHTNSAIGAIARLTNLGIPSDILAGNIIGIIAQRLVRRLCPLCKAMARASRAERALLGESRDIEIAHPTGCTSCHFTGYRGRLAICETIRIDAELDELIAQHANLTEISKLVSKRGVISLQEDGLARVRDGSTALEELKRVVDLSARM